MADFLQEENNQTTTTQTNGTGISAMGNREYKSILRDKEPILQQVMKQVMTEKIEEEKEDGIQFEYLEFYMEEYRKKLGKEYKKYFPYENTNENRIEKPELNNRNQRGRNNRDEVAKFNTILNTFNSDLNDMLFDEENIIPLFMNFNFKINKYLSMNKWAIMMYKKLDSGVKPNQKYVVDCLLSYSRAIEDLRKNNPYGEDFEKAFIYIEAKLLKIINKIYDLKNNLNIIFTNPDIIVESTWDKSKSSFIKLYPEQNEVLNSIIDSVKTNSTQLLMYKVPPGNGKTMISVPIAAKLNEFYCYLIRNRMIGGKDDFETVLAIEKIKKIEEEQSTSDVNQNEDDSDSDSDSDEEPVIKVEEPENKEIDTNTIVLPELDLKRDQTKYFLYICYNNLVRTEVASMCNAIGVDLPFWMCTSEQFGQKIDVLLRPWKKCYDNWKKAKKNRSKKKEDEKYRFASLPVQWAYFQKETQRRPVMIISDLYSAVHLLRTFPERFVVYFDETFASTDKIETLQILENLPKNSVFVSATLPEPNEIPNTIQHFRMRHNCTNDTFIKMVKLNRQHVSSTIVAPDGCIYYPHQAITTIDQLNEAIENIRNDPLKIRCYSPLSVYLMANNILQNLPEELKFSTRYQNVGNIRHEDSRNYAIDILTFVANSGNEELFNKIMTFRPRKMDNLDKHLMLTSNAYNYQDGNTIYTSSLESYKDNVKIITSPILKSSPKIGPAVTKLLDDIQNNNDLIDSIIANPEQHRLKTRNEINKKLVELQSKKFRIQWTPQLIVNSEEHGKLFNRKIYNPSPSINIDVNILKELNEKVAQLALSGIGLYHPESMKPIENEAFKQLRNDFKFILSTPAIVYGTNMSISNVDIDESFGENASRNSIYQLMGRAGRRGKKSYNAMIIFRDWNSLHRVMAPTYEDVESNKAEIYFANLLNNN
jgi:hypothetical protein